MNQEIQAFQKFVKYADYTIWRDRGTIIYAKAKGLETFALAGGAAAKKGKVRKVGKQ